MKKIRKGDVVIIHGCVETTEGILGIVTGHPVKGPRILWKVDIGDGYGDSIYADKYLEVIDHIDETSEPIPPFRKEELTLDRAVSQLNQFFIFEEDTVDAASWRLVKTKLIEGHDPIVYVNGNKYRVREGKTYNHTVDIVCAHCDHTVLTLDLERIIVNSGCVGELSH